LRTKTYRLWTLPHKVLFSVMIQIQQNKEHAEEVTIMRHVLIRGIMGLIWLAAAIISGVSGNLEMSSLYVILGGVFLYSSYTTWKKDYKGGR